MIRQHVMDDLVAFCAGRKPGDDVTLVVVRCVETEPEPAGEAR